MDFYNRIQAKLIGIKGIKCRCCNEFRCKTDRSGKKHYNRLARRSAKFLLKEEINEALNSDKVGYESQKHEVWGLQDDDTVYTSCIGSLIYTKDGVQAYI